tara:strand:- start:190 stop:480 length:291 start_codon:yes stop_codon:yes gene_type:complete
VLLDLFILLDNLDQEVELDGLQVVVEDKIIQEVEQVDQVVDLVDLMLVLVMVVLVEQVFLLKVEMVKLECKVVVVAAVVVMVQHHLVEHLVDQVLL